MRFAPKLIGLTAIIVVITIALSLTACDNGTTPSAKDTTPTAADFTIGSLAQTAGNVTGVTITPKSGKSSGDVTIYYEGINGTTYGKSTTPPQTSGTYAVTFDIAAANGYKAATGLSAGTLTISTAAPSVITYTVAQSGGADGTADTTAIVFTFSASVDSFNLTAADVTVGGNAQKSGNATLSGTGAARTLAVTASGAGAATVQIVKSGIEAETKNITVYKAGETAPTLTGITAVYNGAETLSIAAPINGLKADLTVKAQYSDSSEVTLSDSEYALSVSGGVLTVGLNTITVTYEDKTTTFTVTAEADLPGTITISPSSGVVTGTELTATYSGSEAVTYQWKKDGVNVGENSNKYTPTEAGTYTVTVSASGYNSKTSAVVDVSDSSLSTLTGTITISPSSGVVTGTELTANYSGSEAVTYQWRKDVNTTVGTNANKYTPTEAGSYTVTVSAAGYNPKTSEAVTVTAPVVIPDLPGTIAITPSGGVVTGTELTANYSGSEAVTYQWRKDVNATVGTNANTYTPTEAGSYTVTVSASGYNSKTSPAVVVLTTVNIAAIEGVDAPIIGAAPATAITPTAQYTGAVAWSPDHSTFAAATVYTATITLTPKDGYTLQGVGANSFTVAEATTVSNSANSGVITAVFPQATVTTIGSGRGGSTRSITIDMYDFYGDGWNGNGTLRINVNGVDIANVKVETTAANNNPSGQRNTNTYTFNAEPNDAVEFYWVAGNYQEEVSFIVYYTDTPPVPDFTASNNNSWNGSNALVYRLRDTMTNISGGTLLGSLDFKVIQGVGVPVLDGTPAASIIENERYTGTVTWSPDHLTFGKATVYTATITITPKTGFTLQGVSANFFTVSGAASVSNSANSGVVTAVFPATTAYVLGETGPGGGKVFYINLAGFTMTDTNEVCHYLEAAPDNAATGTLAWASSEDYRDTNIEGTVTAIGGGRKNTALILAIDEDAPAAKACADYRGPNNLADWFLPSTNEQIALYNGRTYVGNMTAATYWSSTQTYIFGNYLATQRNFSNGFTTDSSKTGTSYVRAIRAF